VPPNFTIDFASTSLSSNSSSSRPSHYLNTCISSFSRTWPQKCLVSSSLIHSHGILLSAINPSQRWDAGGRVVGSAEYEGVVEKCGHGEKR
jgi:hypothetical protein